MKLFLRRQYFQELAETAALTGEYHGKFKEDVDHLLNVKPKKLKMTSVEEGLVLNEKVMLDRITAKVKIQFKGEIKDVVEVFTGVPRSLDIPLTGEEVAKAARKLRNNRATGDGFPAENFKEGGAVVHGYLAEIFNDMFSKHKDISSLHTSVFHMINKPNKPYTLQNMRPIQLLNAIRKLFSIIIHARVYHKLCPHVQDNNFGFLRGRGREMQLWNYAAMDAGVNKSLWE
jgi:hypothetical protein